MSLVSIHCVGCWLLSCFLPCEKIFDLLEKQTIKNVTLGKYALFSFEETSDSNNAFLFLFRMRIHCYTLGLS